MLRYRAVDGGTEVALVEWKLVEDYRGKELSGGQAGRATRERAHRAAWEAGSGPIRRELVDYDELFVDPLYQLFRLQMLAAAMERTGELGADVVRLVWVVPEANDALTPYGRRWGTLLRTPDRFAVLDSRRFAEEPLGLTDAEYVRRYAFD